MARRDTHSDGPTDDEANADANAEPLRYASGYHAPVLCNSVVEALLTEPDGVYVDGTLGGGGHTAALLEALGEDGRVVGIDRDADALAEAGRRLAAAVDDGRLLLMRGNFGDLAGLLEGAGIEAVDGVLLDLGISSHQVDVATRGFSYAQAGDLDMRMDQRGGLTAADVVNAWDEHDLRRALGTYGEEPRAGRIARAIVRARPLRTTAELADTIRSAVPTRDEVKSLSRVFQALRIVVNGELDALETALTAATNAVRPGGRMAIIAYHSLEDRRVKRFFRYGNLEGKPIRDVYGNLLVPWKEHTRKPVAPSRAEVAANPRARSARLRVAERLADPDLDQAYPPLPSF